jgi:small subunit ribosomal protein S18
MADEQNKPAAPSGGVATADAPSARTEGGAPQGGSSHTSTPREGGYRGGGGGDRGPRPGGRPGGGPGSGPREGGGGGGRKFFRRKKVCKFCVEKIDGVDYKDVRLLSGFVSEAGKIVPRRLTGVCTPHQRRLADAIKQARNIALLPFGGR